MRFLSLRPRFFAWEAICSLTGKGFRMLVIATTLFCVGSNLFAYGQRIPNSCHCDYAFLRGKQSVRLRVKNVKLPFVFTTINKRLSNFNPSIIQIGLSKLRFVPRNDMGLIFYFIHFLLNKFVN